MSRLPPRTLVVMTGAIASGKTTLAWNLAERARSAGLLAAALDMDEFVDMVGGRDWSLVTPAHRHTACEVAAAAVQCLFDSGTALVAVAGSTVSAWESERIVDRVVPAPSVTHVLLRVAVEEAVSRAQADPTRGSTRNPDVVRRLHASADWASAPSRDIELVTDTLDETEVADRVWSRLHLRAGAASC